jgi:FkbM family methyltransferase
MRENDGRKQGQAISLATRVRPLAVAAIRSLPNVRGRGRLSLAVNGALLAAGAESKSVAKMTAGHSLLVDSRVQSHCWILFLGIYNERFVRALLPFLRPGGAALDVGANLGFVTVPLALAAKRVGGRVVAVEPFAGNAAWLRQNLQINHVDDLVTVVEAGLSSAPKEALLLLREDFAQGAGVGTASVAEEVVDDRFQQVPIHLRTLDDLWPEMGDPRLDVIKVDIDGHEDRFLEGGAHTIATHRPVILTEVCRPFYRRRGLDFDRLIPSLLPPGYRFFLADLTEVKDLADCEDGDVLLIPEERASQISV